MEEERAKRRQAPAETESPDSALGATNRTFAANRAVTVAFVRHAWRVTAKGAQSCSDAWRGRNRRLGPTRSEKGPPGHKRPGARRMAGARRREEEARGPGQGVRPRAHERGSRERSLPADPEPEVKIPRTGL
jgi:hypothetical protein